MRYYPIVAELTTLAAGQSDTVRVNIDKGAGKFTVRRLYGAAFLVNALNSAPAGTALPKLPETDSAASPLPTLQEVRYAIKVTQDQQRSPLLLSGVADSGALMFEPADLPEFNADDSVLVTFYNDSDEDLRVRLELFGSYSN